VKRVLIIGAGAQGAPCASILARDRGVEEIVLGDIDLGLANKVKEKIGSDKITTVKLDAGKIDDIERAAEGMDVIINLTLCQFNANIMEAALRSGAHYVDAALNEPIWTQLVKGQPLELDDEFKAAGLTALIACGGTPGVTNVLVRYACDKLDRVDEIRIKVGGKILGEPDEVVSAWDPGWSPEIALMDYAGKPVVFEDGKYKEYPPFSECEEYNFPEPVGPILICHHNHEESLTLPRFIGKGIKYCDFKYPLDPTAGAFIKMGFASAEPIDVKGVKVAPMDVLMKLVRHPVDTFLTENENTAKLAPKFTFFMVMEIKGAKSGENVTYILSQSSPSAEENLELYRKFGTAEIFVALPAVVGAKMCVEGDAPSGVIAPECLDVVKFLKKMTEMGTTVKFSEVCSKEVAIL